MFMKNEKKKGRRLLAIGVGARAMYGAYSAVSCMKEACRKKMDMITKVVKKNKNKGDEHEDGCVCDCD